MEETGEVMGRLKQTLLSLNRDRKQGDRMQRGYPFRRYVTSCWQGESKLLGEATPGKSTGMDVAR